MKRFIFICVALIAFLATNASGTNTTQIDQRQTFYQSDHPVVLLPAFEAVEVAFYVPKTYEFNLYLCPENLISKTLLLIKPVAYCNPDYGMNSHSDKLFIKMRSTNKSLIDKQFKLIAHNKYISKMPYLQLE